MSRSPRRRVLLAVAALVASGVTGCASASPKSPPTGVDELVIPTPTPMAEDFVGVVDNPYLSYAWDAGWSYAVDVTTPTSTAAGDEGEQARSVEVTVGPGPTVDGVATTSVATTTTLAATGEVLTRTVDDVAQDRGGNVWWFGREGEWTAGVDDAEAGLLMAATPRRGDGYAMASVGDAVDVRAQVEATDAEIEVGGRTYTDVVVLTVTDAEAATTERRWYAPEVGLVRSETLTGLPVVQLGLVAYDEPQ